MRKDKGYQKDLRHYSYRTRHPANSYASGENKSLEQYLADIDKRFDERIADAKKSYARIATKTTLSGKALRDYCREWMLWEVKFDNESNLIPLEDVLAELEHNRERYKASKSYGYVRRTVNKDNQKFVYNSSDGGDNHHRVRIPSIKRSDATWKRFYELFPYYKEHYAELNNKNGIKLKKVW